MPKLRLLVPIFLLLAPLASADPGKNSGKGKGNPGPMRVESSSPSDCCARVGRLEAEVARLRAELERCDRGGHGGGGPRCDRPHPGGSPGGPCPSSHPCPCREFPCTPRPGACDGDHDGDDDDASGCVRSHGYWKTHDDWPMDGELCDRTWREVLAAESEGDAWTILARQWVAARLNQAAGADVPADVLQALRDGRRLLDGCRVSSADRSRALEIKDVLDAYVNGREGVAKCR